MLAVSTTPVSATSISPVNHPITPTKPDSVGPSIEPISPVEPEHLAISQLRLGKSTNPPLYETRLNSLAKKEVGVNMYNEKLSALISEQLLSGKFDWFLDCQ